MRLLYFLVLLFSFSVHAEQLYSLDWPAAAYCSSTGTKAALADCLNNGSYKGKESRFRYQSGNQFYWSFGHEGSWIDAYGYWSYETSCPSGTQLINGLCQEPNYCDTPAAASAISDSKNSCITHLPVGSEIKENNYYCNRETESIDGVCSYQSIDDGNGCTGDMCPGGGDSGSGGDGDLTPGDGSGGDGDTSTPGGDSGSGGDGDTSKPGDGDTGTGGDGDTNTPGDGDTGTGEDTGTQPDNTGDIISAIQKGNDSITSHLNKLLDADVAVNATLEEQLALYNKYVETAKTANSQLEHMANFTEQELAVLRSMQGEYMTNFDRNYNKLDEVKSAVNVMTSSVHDDNMRLVNEAVKQFKEMEALNAKTRDSNDSLANIAELTKGLGDNQVASNDKLDENNQKLNQLDDSLDEINKTLVANGELDKQWQSDFNDAMQGMYDAMAADDANRNGQMRELLDMYKQGNKDLADGIAGVNDGIDELVESSDALGGLDVSGAGTVACFQDNSCKGFYTSKYPDGVTGLVTTFTTDLRNGESFAFLDGFNVDVSNAAQPDFSINFDLGRMGNYGRHSFDIPAYIWAFIRACIMFGAAILSRALVFGG